MNKIFLVEDDDAISNSIKKSLEKWDYNVSLARDFTDIMSDFNEFSPNLVILDITLPFFNGYHWCREIRKVSKVPIIFLSSASENLNIIMAMEAGADDYITKPFDMEILLAKIKALFRRSYDFVKELEFIHHQGIELNLSQMKLSFEDKSTLLTKNEFKILEYLLRNKGDIISREKLMEILWQSDEYIDDNTLTVNVARLRRKLEEMSLDDLIKTKIGVGYYVQEN